MTQMRNDFTKGAIPGLVTRMALPIIGAQIVNALYNIVDRMYIGRLPGVGSLALTGVGVTFPLILLISAFAQLSGMGGAPLCSIARGEGKDEYAERILGTSFSLLLLFGAAAAETPRPITPLADDEVPAPPEGQHNYLLACMDNWEGNPKILGNTDGVILVTLDTAQKRVVFSTLTREMLIQRPDGGVGRFTYIAKNYGMDALCHIVSTHFGVEVKKYALFSMNSIQDIIDAMGGVNITVTDAEADYLNRYRISRDSTTPSMDKAGTYLFGGHAAVIYMRIRKVGGDGDAGRTRRIRTVLSTLTEKQREISLGDALNLLEAVTNTIVLTNMTMQDMLEGVGYAMELRGVAPEGYQIPQNDALEDITYAGMQTRQVDFAKTRKFLWDTLGTSDDIIMDWD